MSGLETKHSEVAEVPSHQQNNDNDARVLHNLGYNQELTVSALSPVCTLHILLTKSAQVRAFVKSGFHDNRHGNL